ncbi:hypothetical protein FOZ60_003795 [Perkinsus olseni]|uniref:Uncharacterized protein n=1 Tax=Perkinsus olseni TaxID=32597 RepID=A0A7J6NUL6_PEROL|nr:hypothetical protein FOZ60_003795 [Perkinsus olseni]
MSANGNLLRLQELLEVPPERRGESMQHFLEIIRQEDPPTPTSARQYEHSPEDFTGAGINRRPRPVTGEDGRVRKLHDRNGQLMTIAPNSSASYSPKWFSARSISGALRALVSWGFPWVRDEVLAEAWGEPFLWDDGSVELCAVAAFYTKVIDVPSYERTVAGSARDDLAVKCYACGFFLSRELAYFCDVCTCVVKVNGHNAGDQIWSLRRHFASNGHRDNQCSLPGRANRGRLSMFPFFFMDHECFRSLSARQFMDNLQSDGLNPALKRFAAVLRAYLRPGTHFVYIHRGLGRLFCLSRRERFAPSNHRSGSAPFVLEEGTCPYDRVINRALRRLREDNFGMVRPDVDVVMSEESGVGASREGESESSARPIQATAIPPPPPLPVGYQVTSAPPLPPPVGYSGVLRRPENVMMARPLLRPVRSQDRSARPTFPPLPPLPEDQVQAEDLRLPTVGRVPPTGPSRRRDWEGPPPASRYEHHDQGPADVPRPLPMPRSSLATTPYDRGYRYGHGSAVSLAPAEPRVQEIEETPAEAPSRPVELRPARQELAVVPASSSAQEDVTELRSPFPRNVVPIEEGAVLLTSVAGLGADGLVVSDMFPAQVDVHHISGVLQVPGSLLLAATITIQIPTDVTTGLAIEGDSALEALAVSRPRGEEEALQDLLSASPSARAMDDTVDWREFDVRSLANTEAEVDVINQTLESLPISEDLGGFVPPLRPGNLTNFDWDIDSTIRRAGMSHPGWTSPWPFRPGPYMPWRMVALRRDQDSARGDMTYLERPPYLVTRDQVLNGDWGTFWRGFDASRGCPGLLKNEFVAFNHPLVAGVVPSFDEDCSARLLFLNELGEGPTRGHSTREEAWPADPVIPCAHAILRWLHSAQLGAMAVTIHCSGGSAQGVIRSEASVLFCCEYHLEDSLVSVMRLSRERPLMPNSYVFSAHSNRAFDCGLLDDQGRPSGLDRPESLVDMLYKYESVRARDGHPLPRTPLTPFPEPFDLRPRDRVSAPATGVNRPRRPERYSLNYGWSRVAGFEGSARETTKVRLAMDKTDGM